jgi:hypothetical protein
MVKSSAGIAAAAGSEQSIRTFWDVDKNRKSYNKQV